MKKGLCIVGFLVLLAQLPLWCLDTSPSPLQLIPEAIWASATGGGTWVTELQVTNLDVAVANVAVLFVYADGNTGAFALPTPLPAHQTAKYYNILSTMDSIDPSAQVYYGRVGALYVFTGGAVIQVQAKTVNGSYGKTFPGLNMVADNTAAQDRMLMIQDLIRSSEYRTFVGAFNTSSTATYTVTFSIMDAGNNLVGSVITKTLSPNAFVSFNPFTEAGISSGTYDNCWLLIHVTAGGTAAAGVMCFGSQANNYTNDTYALLARKYLQYV
jgi:hypothetical protein